MSGPTNWRDRIKVHPAVDLFPMMSSGELQELARDISEHGLRQGIVFWTPDSIKNAHACKLPDDLYLLDGRNRLEAIEIGYSDKDERRKAIEDTICIDSLQADGASLLDCETDPYAFVVSANIRRRHLTAAQKRDVIAELLKANPEQSDRTIARIADSNHNTVARVRKESEERGDVARSATRTDRAGRQQLARKKAAARPAAVSTPPSRARDKAIASFSQLLHQQLANTLDDLTRILRGEGNRIREIPKPKRQALARAYLDALGVGLDDLNSGRVS